MAIKDKIHATATGPRRKRWLLTPVGFLLFAGAVLAVILGGLALDRLIPVEKLLPIPVKRLLPRSVSTILGLALIIPGLILSLSCVVQFLRAGGTPIPINPPEELIVTGLYLWMRNPMLTGLFGMLLGTGFLLQSLSIVLITTPIFIIAFVIELKKVEEPELEQRFGDSYREYKRRVPMFIPRPGGVSDQLAPRSGYHQDCIRRDSWLMELYDYQAVRASTMDRYSQGQLPLWWNRLHGIFCFNR
ncbi:methyltransferase family protein [Gemmatimonadota bacterium]